MYSYAVAWLYGGMVIRRYGYTAVRLYGGTVKRCTVRWTRHLRERPPTAAWKMFSPPYFSWASLFSKASGSSSAAVRRKVPQAQGVGRAALALARRQNTRKSCEICPSTRCRMGQIDTPAPCLQDHARHHREFQDEHPLPRCTRHPTSS